MHALSRLQQAKLRHLRLLVEQVARGDYPSRAYALECPSRDIARMDPRALTREANHVLRERHRRDSTLRPGLNADVSFEYESPSSPAPSCTPR